MKTGQLIKELRLKKGMTQEDLAAKTYISARTIQRIENDEVDPRAYSLKIIAAALEVDFEELANCDKEASEDTNPDYNSIWLALLHLSGLFLLLFPPVTIWLWKKDQIKNIRERGIDVINLQLAMLIVMIPSAIFSILLIPILIVIFLRIFRLYLTCFIS